MERLFLLMLFKGNNGVGEHYLVKWTARVPPTLSSGATAPMTGQSLLGDEIMSLLQNAGLRRQRVILLRKVKKLIETSSYKIIFLIL